MRLKDIDDQWILKQHFFGIYKKRNDRLVLVDPSDETNELEPSVINNEIAAAVEHLHELIAAEVKQVEHIVDWKDYDPELMRQNCYIHTRKYPVTKVHSVSFKYGEQGQTIYTVPAEYIQYKPEHNIGMIQLLPNTSLGGDLSPLWFAGFFNSNIPSLLRIEYDAGLEGLPKELPMSVVKVIGMLASLQIFSILGDIMFGAGVASFSQSFDGYSTSIGTTQSAENSAYSARIDDYTKKLHGSSISGTPGLISLLQKQYSRIVLGLL